MSRVTNLITLGFLLASLIAGFFFYSYFFIFNTSEAASVTDTWVQRDVTHHFTWVNPNGERELSPPLEDITFVRNRATAPSERRCPSDAQRGTCQFVGRVGLTFNVEVTGVWGSTHIQEFPENYRTWLRKGHPCRLHTNMVRGVTSDCG